LTFSYNFYKDFETEIEKESLKDVDAETEEYERQTALFEKEIEFVIAETKRCEEEAKFYAERSFRGLETMDRLVCFFLLLFIYQDFRFIFLKKDLNMSKYIYKSNVERLKARHLSLKLNLIEKCLFL
jgi:hypothetical protein